MITFGLSILFLDLEQDVERQHGKDDRADRATAEDTGEYAYQIGIKEESPAFFLLGEQAGNSNGFKNNRNQGKYTEDDIRDAIRHTATHHSEGSQEGA